MNKFFLNGQVQDYSQLMLNFHGNSVFTTMRSKNGHLLMWELHWQRLKEHSLFFGYSVPHESRLVDFLLTHVQSAPSDQKIRVIIAGDDVLITLEPYQAPAKAIYDGVTVIVSSHQPHPQLGSYKTGNSLPYLLAHQEAQKQGAFEALLLDNHGYVVDGSRTSIMHFDGKELLCLEGGLLGCMREEALSYAQKSGIKIRRDFCKFAQLDKQILLANSLMGVVPVGLQRFSFTDALIERFRMDTP